MPTADKKTSGAGFLLVRKYGDYNVIFAVKAFVFYGYALYIIAATVS